MSCFCQVAEERAQSIHSFFQKLGSVLKQLADARPQAQCNALQQNSNGKLNYV